MGFDMVDAGAEGAIVFEQLRCQAKLRYDWAQQGLERIQHIVHAGLGRGVEPVGRLEVLRPQRHRESYRTIHLAQIQIERVAVCDRRIDPQGTVCMQRGAQTVDPPCIRVME